MFINLHGVRLELNKKSLTASVVFSREAEGDVVIPFSVFHESNEYIITDISEGSFKYSKIKSLKIIENSMIRSIPSYVFEQSTIQSLHLPTSIEKLEKLWCFYTPNLINITVSENNKIFRIHNQNMLLGKSNLTSENYDVLYFASRDIEDVIIPSTIKVISSCCFESCQRMKSIEISTPSELEIIDKYAFSKSSIDNLKIPKHVRILEDYSFSNCKHIHTIKFEPKSELTKLGESSFSSSNINIITIPDKITTIEENTFSYCKNLTTIKYTENSKLTTIKSEAFVYSSIEELFLPSLVYKLEDHWCSGASKLKLIKVSPNNRYLKAIDNKILIGKSNIKSENYDVLYFTSRDIENIIIPSSIKRINSCCFEKCNKLKSIQFSDDSELEIIDKAAFSCSTLESIKIPKNVSIIDDYAFFMCQNIESIELYMNSKLCSIGKSAFESSSIKFISIPKNVSIIGDNAFYSCINIHSIKFDANSKLHFLGKSAFESSNITAISIPENVTIIEENTFSNCENLTIIEFLGESKLTTIKSGAFSNTPKLTKIKLKNNNFESIDGKFLIGKSNLTSENYDVLYFASRDIEDVVIPSTIKVISSCCFESCQRMKSIEISTPSELEIIDKYAFSKSSIDNLKIPKHVRILEDYSFSNCQHIHTIKFEPKSELTKLGESSFSSSNINIITIPDKVTTIEESTFSYCENLTTVEFLSESALSIIKSGAFSSTPKLTEIKLNNQHFYSIGYRILIGKSNLTSNNYDTLYFVSRDIENVIIPSTIKHTSSFALTNSTQIEIIEMDKSSELEISPIWMDLPIEYKTKIDEICNKEIKNIYSLFTFKYYDFNETKKSENIQNCIDNINFNLFFYLVNFKFITFYLTNKNQSYSLYPKTDCVFCIENECIIIENIDILFIDILIQKLKKNQISLINLSNNSDISIKPNCDSKEEVQNFYSFYFTEINQNYFVKYTINSIAGFLIRRYFYPSTYFREKSFFIYNKQNKRFNEQHIKTEIKEFLFDENIFKKTDNIADDIKSLEENSNNNLNHETFSEDDFIVLRDIYAKNDLINHLVIHKQSLHIFLMKKLNDLSINDKDLTREIDFCKYSHRCFTPFYGFLKKKNNIIGFLYEFMTNGSLKSFIKNNKLKGTKNDLFLLITLNRIFEGIECLHKENIIHRDIKPSNILIDNNYLAYISDFETARSTDLTDTFTSDIGSIFYSSPEQDETGIVSFSTDIYSFGLVIYYMYEKHDMWSQNSDKNKEPKRMTKGPEIIQNLYKKCVQRLPENRIKTSEIRKIIYECFNSFHFFNEYLHNEKSSINDMQMIDYIFEKICNQKVDEFLSVHQNQINGYHRLFLLKVKNSKSNRLSNVTKFENDLNFLNNCYSMNDKESWILINVGYMYEYGYGVEKDYVKANEYYKQSSKLNNSSAFFYLGLNYERGLGVRQDYLKAKEYYEQSANLGNQLAIYQIGNLYYLGYGVKQDYLKAKEYYKKSRNSNGFYQIGTLYEYGRGVKRNYLKAIKYYEKSCEFNNSNALNKMGNLYFYGHGVKQDYLKAKEYYERSSEFKNTTAFYNLASLYYYGHGVKQDYSKAKEYYEKSAALNDSDSINILGTFYENRLGVEQDFVKAKQLYEKASKLNNSDAIFNLGNIFYKGFGVKQDFLKAKEYFEKASEFNNSNALNNLGNLYFYGHGVKQDYLKAKEYYERSSKFNNWDAFINLGNLYYYGYGVTQDYIKAKKLYEISSKYNNPIAYFYMGDLYSLGYAIDIDLSKAIKYYLKSIKTQRGLISSYNIIDKSFNVKFDNNNYHYISYNNLGLIYIIDLDDIEKSEKYMKESAFAEHPFGQNNFGLFSQLFLKKDANAKYLFNRSSKNNFALAFYNLGNFYEERKKTEKSIKNFILASEYEDEPLVYRNITHYDRRLEISKMFIICLTNLKLVYYYFSIEKFDESKKYFKKVFNKFNLIDTNFKYSFKLKLKLNKESPNKYSNDALSYIKFYILNFPLFNLINQPNMNVNSYIFHKKFQIETKDNKNYDMKTYEMKSNSPKKYFNNNKNEKMKKNYVFQIDKKNEKNDHIKQKDIKNNEIIFEDPNKLFDFIINKSYSIYDKNQEFSSNIKEIFINEITEIINIMKKILYTPPYSILFGRISLNKPKTEKKKEISK